MGEYKNSYIHRYLATVIFLLISVSSIAFGSDFNIENQIDEIFADTITKIKITVDEKIQRNEEILGKIEIDGLGVQPIKIRRRGNSSDKFKKKQYQVKILDDSGKTKKLSVLGFEPGKKWVLNAPYIDRTLIRNPLVFSTVTKLDPNWYAPKTRFMELEINNEYQGVYVLIEKIDRGKNKVNIGKFSSDNLEFIAEVQGEKFGPDADFKTKKKTPVQYYYPSLDDLNEMPDADMAKRRIKEAIDVLEWKVNTKNTYENIKKIIDVKSFANYLLTQEVFKNLDGFRRSMYFHYKKGKFYMGPVWDYNCAMGMVNFYNMNKTKDLLHTTRVFIDGNNNVTWFRTLMKFAQFKNLVVTTYIENRKPGGVFHMDSFNKQIDTFVSELGNAPDRNFKRWKVLGKLKKPIWSNPKPRPKTYTGEINKLKKWLKGRLEWLDSNLK